VDRHDEVRIEDPGERWAPGRSIVNVPPMGGQNTSTSSPWHSSTSVSPGQ
jgi:hypothetical protein